MILADTPFKNLYSEKGLIYDNKLLTLHNKCPYNQNCWKDILSKKPQGDDFWTITKPWIGKEYSKLRLLAIGINMNEYGSYEGANKLINWSKVQIKEGKVKMFVSDTYSGTFLFHRLGCYASAFAEKKLLLKTKWLNQIPHKEVISSAFDYIAYTNHIKCSPVGDKSEPSEQMWNNCGAFLLREEIGIIDPDTILILGTSKNFYHFNMNVLDAKIEVKWNGSIGEATGSINNKKIKIYIIPHPSAYGGSSKSIIDELRSSLE